MNLNSSLELRARKVAKKRSPVNWVLNLYRDQTITLPASSFDSSYSLFSPYRIFITKLWSWKYPCSSSQYIFISFSTTVKLMTTEREELSCSHLMGISSESICHEQMISWLTRSQVKVAIETCWTLTWQCSFSIELLQQACKLFVCLSFLLPLLAAYCFCCKLVRKQANK